MKKIIYPFLIPVLIFLAGCAPKSDKAFYYTKLDGRQVQEIFLDRVSNDTMVLNFSDLFSSFRAVPLETREECLVQNVSLTLAGEDLLVGTQHFPGPAMLYRFDKNGKYLNAIGRGGKGPGEHSGYLQTSCRYYPDDHTVLVLWVGDNPQLFHIDGTLLKTIKMPFWNLDNIFKWNDREWFSTGRAAGIPHDGIDSVLAVFYRDDGTITGTVPRTLYPPAGTNGYVPIDWGASIYSYEPDWRIYIEGIDTVFSLKDKKLIPAGILHPGKIHQDFNHATDPKYLKGKFNLEILAETKNNLFIKKSVIKKADVRQFRPGRWGGSFDMDDYLIVIDKKNGNGAYCKGKDDIYGILPGKAFPNLHWHTDGFVSLGIPVGDLHEMIKDAESKGNIPPEISARLEPLKELNDEDNPVIFLFHLNDHIKIK